jgi:hypothetical protein
VCGCAKSACPLPAGVGNSLGFSGVGACCAAPCPLFPLHKVHICLQINRATCARIQQGCLENDQLQQGCIVKYGWGQLEDTWGRECRTIVFDRAVPRNSFIRIRLCSCDGCDASCGVDSSLQYNQLKSFQVDGVEYAPLLDLVRGVEPDGSLGCLQVNCYGDSSCCDEDVFRTTGSLAEMPVGSQIVFGPIGQTIPEPVVG